MKNNQGFVKTANKLFHHRVTESTEDYSAEDFSVGSVAPWLFYQLAGLLTKAAKSSKNKKAHRQQNADGGL